MIELIKQNFNTNKKLYNKIKIELNKELKNNYPILHVGSTAIPNMYGKNIIDILIGVKTQKELDDVSEKLMSIGYFKSKNNKEKTYRFFSSSLGETKSGDIHIHLSIIDTERYNEFIILKNYLLNNLEEVKNYSEFKKQIIKEGIINRKNYKKVKSEYVTNLIERAKEQNKR